MRFALERDVFPRVTLCEQRAQELVVERVPRFVRGVSADQRVAQQVQVADRVENLVLDQFVVVAQAVIVQDTEVVEDDRIVEAAAERKAHLAHRLHFLHEAEGAGAAILSGGTSDSS